MTDHDPKDYSWLPADVQAFIAKTDAAYPPDAVNFTIAEQRAFYDKLCAAFDPPHPAGLVAEDLTIAGVPCRRYTPTAPRAGVTALYFHGGGFVVGGLHSHDSICAELAEGAQVVLIAVDYRLAPEHKHPAAYDDCVAVAGAVAGPKVLLGDSAGANLAAAVSATRPGIVGQVLIYGSFGDDLSLPSFTRHAFAPMLTRADIEFYGMVRYEGSVRPSGDVTATPMVLEDFSILPPTALFSAEADPVASDSVEYAARLAEAGVEVELTEEPGLVHGYLRARHMSEGARDSFARITRALEALAARGADQ
ncbi:MAG: alpha/beta hydrolase [Rhodobacter sp.]|nr:alpha/beta hydrolase [Paracoccaceae bacterium]MCC0076827.1 alpha/beta hydrolase [Rhodobacter sp.]